MKKLVYSLLCSILVTTACSIDNKRVFDETAGVRANQVVEHAYATLTGAPEGWKMTYYPDASLYGGYQFIFKFNNQNRVDMACDLGAEVQTSSYRVDLSQGPMLVFDTYSYIHLLAEPSTAPVPTGLGGDYEFLIREITAEKLTLVGRKRQVTAVLERATSQDWINLTNAYSIQSLCSLQEHESWQLSVNGVRQPGALSLDVVRHNYSITCGANSVKGTYRASATELIFDEPATLVVDEGGSSVTFGGFMVRLGSMDADRTIVSSDPEGTLAFSIKLNIPVTEENIITYNPDPDVNSIDAFLNLKNADAGSTSLYIITLMSPKYDACRSRLLDEYPIFQGIRIISPRSVTILLQIRFFFDINGAIRNYALNCNNGLTPITENGCNPLTDAVFAYSGAAFDSGTNVMVNHPDYIMLRDDLFRRVTGFTIIRDGDNFWFRSIADPNDWFKCEPN